MHLDSQDERLFPRKADSDLTMTVLDGIFPGQTLLSAISIAHLHSTYACLRMRDKCKADCTFCAVHISLATWPILALKAMDFRS